MEKKVHSMELHLVAFLSYENHDYIGPLCIKLPQMIVYLKCLDNYRTVSFKTTKNNLLEKYTKIWSRVIK